MIDIHAPRRAAVAVATALILAASASGALAFSATFSWCEGGASPSFTLKDMPVGTASVEFAMTDLDKPSFHHGGGKIGYRGQPEVPCGAFDTGFVGPSPPPGEVHTYQFVIKALGVGGTVLATTTARRKFPE